LPPEVFCSITSVSYASSASSVGEIFFLQKAANKKLIQTIVKADELDKPELIGILLLINILYPFVGITFLLYNTFKAAFK
jgi:hypothetical protein